MILLLLFECWVIFLESFQMIVEYSIFLYENYDQSTYDQEEFFYHFSFFMENTLLVTELIHYFHMWFINGFSLSAVDLALFIITNKIFNTCKKNINQFIDYHSLKQIIQDRYPNLTETDLDHERKCTICLENMMVGNGKVLDCRHCFHLHCIKRWVQNSPTCPVCRKNILESNSESQNQWTPWVPFSLEVVPRNQQNQ